MKTQTRISMVKVSPTQIKQLPSVGGEPDIAQYLQVVLVLLTGDQGGQLYIRGELKYSKSCAFRWNDYL